MTDEICYQVTKCGYNVDIMYSIHAFLTHTYHSKISTSCVILGIRRFGRGLLWSWVISVLGRFCPNWSRSQSVPLRDQVNTFRSHDLSLPECFGPIKFCRDVSVNVQIKHAQNDNGKKQEVRVAERLMFSVQHRSNEPKYKL